MHKVAQNKHRTVWNAPANSSLFDQYKPLIPIEALITMLSNSTLQDAKSRIKDKVNWTDECGFAIFGTKKNILEAFGKISYHMCSDTSSYSEDVRQYGSCRTLVMFAVPGTDLSAIIGSDYVFEFNLKFKMLLDSLQNVALVLAGNGYMDGLSPIQVALKQLENKKVDFILKEFEPFLKQHIEVSNEIS